MQPRGAVVEDHFENGFRSLAIAFEAGGHDLAARSGRLIQLQPGDGEEAAAILMTARPMKQQIFNGPDAEPLELHRALTADTPKSRDRFREGRGSRIRGRSRHGPAPYKTATPTFNGKRT